MIWNPNPIALQLGSFSLPWYGLCFATGLVLAILYCYKCAKEESVEQKHIDQLILLCFVGLFLGARLCHCFFYEPKYYFSHPLEILLPIKKMTEGYVFTGYCGLASHGGCFGLLLAVLIFKWYSKVKVLPILDYIAIAFALCGAFIRVGNLINSEIVGAVTDVSWAFVFPVIDNLPRHPAQLYEAIFYFIFFGVMALIYNKFSHKKMVAGSYLAITFIAIGSFRFLVEFFKEVQSPFERSMIINMGQILSLPFILAGIVLLIVLLKKKALID